MEPEQLHTNNKNSSTISVGNSRKTDTSKIKSATTSTACTTTTNGNNKRENGHSFLWRVFSPPTFAVVAATMSLLRFLFLRLVRDTGRIFSTQNSTSAATTSTNNNAQAAQHDKTQNADDTSNQFEVQTRNGPEALTDQHMSSMPQARAQGISSHYLRKFLQVSSSYSYSLAFDSFCVFLCCGHVGV